MKRLTFVWRLIFCLLGIGAFFNSMSSPHAAMQIDSMIEGMARRAPPNSYNKLKQTQESLVDDVYTAAWGGLAVSLVLIVRGNWMVYRSEH